MSFFQIIAVLLTLTALMAYLNHRVLKLPQTIGLMVLALAFSFVLIGLSWVLPGTGIGDRAREVLDQVDFDATLLNGMLGFLLFAGALHVDMGRLWAKKWPVALLATVGVMTSTALVGVMTWCLFGVLGLEVKLIYCLLFGALISPTDPIAVLAILKTLGAPESLETKIAGESLFNDGVGVVVFLALMGVAGFDAHASGHGPPLLRSTRWKHLRRQPQKHPVTRPDRQKIRMKWWRNWSTSASTWAKSACFLPRKRWAARRLAWRSDSSRF